MKKKGHSLKFITTIFLILGFVASTALGAGEAKMGGALKFGAENEFAGFDVLKSGSRLAINGSIAANTLMEPLFQMDDNENLIPVLGISATPAENGKAWIIKLREGVRFHDGTAFTADSVVHHWNRMLNPENKYRGRSAFAPITGVSKIDDLTVRFDLKHPWLPFTRSISGNRSLATLIPSPKAVDQGTQERNPVGTGPFILEKWQPGDSFTVKKNPDYWEKDKPYLDKIVFLPMPDSQTRFAGLQAGQLDIIWMDRGGILSKAKEDPALTVYEIEDNGAEIFILNTSKPPLNDVRVRRALAHAHHQLRQVKMAYQDSIPVVQHPFGDRLKCSDVGYREFDPDKARQILAQYGNPVELEILHSNSKRGRDIGQITQQMFKDVGIQSTPVGLDFGPVVKKVLKGDYQMSTWRISSHPDQGPSLFLQFHSKSRANFSRYQNPEMDKLLVAQRLETNPEKRNELLCRIARLINEDVPILYRGGMRSHAIARKGVSGISMLRSGVVIFKQAGINP